MEFGFHWYESIFAGKFYIDHEVQHSHISSEGVVWASKFFKCLMQKKEIILLS